MPRSHFPRCDVFLARALGVAALLGGGVLPMGGCVTEGRHPRQAPEQPQQVRASNVLISASFPEASLPTGVPDQFDLTIFVFDDRFPASSIRVPGAFLIELFGRRGELLAKWDVPEDRAASSIRTLGPGPAYILRLNTAETGTTPIPPQTADLTVTFKAATGEVVRSGPATLQGIGRRGR